MSDSAASCRACSAGVCGGEAGAPDSEGELGGDGIEGDDGDEGEDGAEVSLGDEGVDGGELGADVGGAELGGLELGGLALGGAEDCSSVLQAASSPTEATITNNCLILLI